LISTFFKRKKSSSKQVQRHPPGAVLGRLASIAAGIFSCFWLSFSVSYDVHAQEQSGITVAPPDVACFPTISVEFKITDAGIESHDVLTPVDVIVIENSQSIPVESLTQEYRGVLFSLVVNAARELDINDADGLSRYDKLSAALQGWASSRTFSAGDTWSFVTNDGVSVRAATSDADWNAGLNAYQPDFRALEPELSGLEIAIKAADERVVSLGVDKVLLYITPPPDADQIEDLLLLAEDARSAGIRVNVWMVGDELYLSNDQGGALKNLASITGGQFFHYTGVETIPDQEAYLLSLGYTYTLTYNSRIRETGTYPLEIEVSLPDLQVSGVSQPFYIDVQPPNPILISPPAQITVEVSSMKDTSGAVLSPDHSVWEIMVEFPDGYNREIVASRLYVDGIVVDVRREVPFDSLSWDFSELTESGEHIIQVEVEDVLGLSARTILTPVQIELTQPGTTPRFSLQQIGIILAVLILAAAFLILIIWFVRRRLIGKDLSVIKTRLFGRRRNAGADQVTASASDGHVLGALIPLGGTGDESEQTLMITQTETIIGMDPICADQVIHDEDISDVHARLHVQEGGFWLQDMGSSTGTWVNYTEIGTKHVQIHPGDLIHFGSVGFRFTIKDNPTPSEIFISKFESRL